MMFTTQITHPDGEIKNDNIFRLGMQKQYIKLAKLKYSNSKIEVMEVRAVLSCWHCGEPVIITDPKFADNVCQLVDKVCCCTKCESLKTDFPGSDRK